jgi:adenylyltransferase/sulfurtransferase
MMLPDPEDAEEITPAQLAMLLTEKATISLIDCREADEWHFTRIDPARHGALSQFPEAGPLLLQSVNDPLVIYCHHGVRSLHLTRWLRRQGCARVYSLQGGIDQWSREIDASVPLY